MKSKCEKSDITPIELIEKRGHLKNSWRKHEIGRKSLNLYVVHFKQSGSKIQHFTQIGPKKYHKKGKYYKNYKKPL